MSTLVYMKLLEQTPDKYDRGMRLLTLGRIDAVKAEIASAWVEPGQEVLEIGSGTGRLSRLMAERGAKVTAVDVSEKMLAAARENAPGVEFLHMTATEIDRLGEGRFDRVVSTLVFSELSDEELGYVLRAAGKLLKPGGRLVVADEVRPARFWQRAAAAVVRFPLAAVTFLLTQNTTHALRDFPARLREAGFRVESESQYLAGTLAVFVAGKA